MKFSYRWLKELSGTKRSPEKLAELLMMHAFEVETLERYPHGLNDIVVGRVLSVKKHPNADRLRVTTVEVGKGDARTIVCGASNVAPGQKVAVILPGGKLPDGSVIREAELRGVKSDGMICSEKELGLGEAHAGILVLEHEAPIGKNLAHVVGLDDWVLDVKILPDRSSDALSYQGLAQEIAALDGVTAAFLNAKPTKRSLRKSSKVPKIILKSPDCEAYVLALFDAVKIEPSPLWLKVKLLVSGIRPINTIVDATNYLMLLTGQPMHAFDAAAINRGGIVVRPGRVRERLMLLDGKTVTLGKEDLVIADTKKALALAGIMGGKHSGISEKTTSVAVEIAHFRGSTTRRTRQRQGLFTDASFRFERGFDIGRPMEALSDLVTLMGSTGWGRFVGGCEALRSKPKMKSILLPLVTVERTLGTTVPLFEVVQHLALLGLTVKKVVGKKELLVSIPPRRMDLRDALDLVEEIGRLRGYAKIDPVAPRLPLAPVKRPEAITFDRRLRHSLAQRGFDEIMTYSFFSEQRAALFGLEPATLLRLENPMNPDQAYLRSTLLPNVLEAVEHNLREYDTFDIFEIGSTFKLGEKQPEESQHLAFASVRPKSVVAGREFFDLKGRIEAWFESLGIKTIFESPAETPTMFHRSRTAMISGNGVLLGHMAEIHPDIRRNLGISARVIVAEFELALLMQAVRPGGMVKSLRRFPLAYRDLSLTGSRQVAFADVQTQLLESGAPLLVAAELFDVYREGEETSYAFHLAFGREDRTIKSAEMDEVFDVIVQRMKEKLGFRLRLS